MAKRTLKQKWVFERLFCHAGSLVMMETRLRNIAEADSTLVLEGDMLLEAAQLIKAVDMKSNQDLSWSWYQVRLRKETK